MMVKKMVEKAEHSAELGAREAILEELFYDFHRSRVKIYRLNFIRGIYFGFGSVLGGTLVVALVIWILGLLAFVFPPVGDFFNSVIEALKQR